MIYAVPDNTPFVVKGEVKTKARKSEVRDAVRDLFRNYKLSVAYDPDSKTDYVNAEPRNENG